MPIRIPLLGAVLAGVISAFVAPALAQPSFLLFESGPVRPIALSPDGSTLYYVIERPAVSGGADYEIRAASPETAPSRVLARIPATSRWLGLSPA